ncbi:MAG TPA: adenine-specific methyltransferase EcoRI family protein [Sulfurovum sp.]|nr:MAG: modification methylase [Sulfurovum sp. 16-42-52]OYZ49422.1 MAG: modification methylase [Sulfurovum sp. 24-42-9]OZA45190.1 MAG: modification methylase [Sulfurovum sp. 17-42-90]OZA59847.1 MAG: modification methylase [Sulfurovum sp. 39-42-12]HQR73991.1 adenine-specific methyltransferase EcoRI family protein [Sulfurovum sp.]
MSNQQIEKKVLNKNLHSAKKGKNDEFYTQLEDIERELKHYKEHFKNKVVYCNCDDPRVSNFFHYFSHNFEKLGLKKLIATCYKNQDTNLFSQNNSENAVYLEYDGDKNGDNVPNVEEIGVHALNGDGDFRSQESIELLKQADIVVTNPPFSLFREYVAQLVEYDKKFVIVGHQNAITYKEIFKLIKENKLWLGYGFKGGAGHFINIKYEDYATASDHKEGMIRVSGVVWFTNLEIKKRHEDLMLYKNYTPEEYPTYDNYDAINVNKTKDIPIDYSGVMGVPITFLDKYNPEQFKILGMSASAGYSEDVVGIPFLGDKDARPLINSKNTYARVFIKNRRLEICK